MTFDRIDLKILDLLQRDATVPIARIADQVGLSQTPCWKRIRKHEAAGVIRGRVAILDPEPLGLGCFAFVLVEAADFTAAWRAEFLAVVETLDPVRAVYRVAGNFDFLLCVVVRDMAAFDRVSEDLTRRVRVRSIKTVFAMERIKVSTALPLDEVTAS